jgi:hypothetical protein
MSDTPKNPSENPANNPLNQINPEDFPKMKTKDGAEMIVPPDGSLGLLAAGYRGIMLWREAKAKAIEQGWDPQQVNPTQSFEETK